MRCILASARQFSRFWLGVHVPREANRDADGLSHPANIDKIMSAARAAGFRPRRAIVSAECFEKLRAALARGLAFRRDAAQPTPRTGAPRSAPQRGPTAKSPGAQGRALATPAET